MWGEETLNWTDVPNVILLLSYRTRRNKVLLWSPDSQNRILGSLYFHHPNTWLLHTYKSSEAKEHPAAPKGLGQGLRFTAGCVYIKGDPLLVLGGINEEERGKRKDKAFLQSASCSLAVPSTGGQCVVLTL